MFINQLVACGLLAATLCLAGGCKTDTVTASGEEADCASASKIVKTLTKAEGLVSFNQAVKQYVISVHQPSTTDVVDLGVVCGALPTALQAEGTKVLVSGTLKEYSQASPSSAPAGYTYYYLAVSQISQR